MPTPIHFDLRGWVGQYLQAVTDQWLLIAPQANPAMLEIFADRDTPPYRNLMPWAGEFAGKYLTSAVLTLRLTNDRRLKSWLEQFVQRLVSLQAEDGYLGPWPTAARLTNFSPYHGQNGTDPRPAGFATWDTWGHYHIMTGLLLWYEDTADAKALDCVCRMADLICEKYLGARQPRLVDTPFTEMNLAPVHALARLHRLTGVPRYLQMALQIVDEFAARGAPGADGQPVPLAGDYLNEALAGHALYQMPRPRWESLHAIMGLVELYRITGEERYRRAFENIWWSIVEFDRHNNGGFSSGEQATGNPYHQGAIETCCTIAWLALSVEMLHLQDAAASIVADEIELATLNSVLGMHSICGRWATYNTPMDGARFASAHSIVFQSRSGSPELNCCSVNSPRGLGMISQWAALASADAITINYYGPGSLESILAGQVVQIRQETEYPAQGRIVLHIQPQAAAHFTLRLRIPYWSRSTVLRLNGQELDNRGTDHRLQAGQYYSLARLWQPGDQLELELDMALHYWSGEKECAGLTSIFRGPLLLAYDQRYNRAVSLAGLAPDQFPVLPDDCFKIGREHLPVPTLDMQQTAPSVCPARDDWHPPFLLLETRTADGQQVFLCDFASAGHTGTLYRSWLPLTQPPAVVPFSRANPLRTVKNTEQ